MPRGGKRKNAGRKPLLDQEKRKSKVIRIPESNYEGVKRFISGDFEATKKTDIEELHSQIKKYEDKLQETKSVLDGIKELLSVKAQRNSAGGLLKNRDQVLEVINTLQKEI